MIQYFPFLNIFIWHIQLSLLPWVLPILNFIILVRRGRGKSGPISNWKSLLILVPFRDLNMIPACLVQVYRDIYLPACLVQVYRDIYLPASLVQVYRDIYLPACLFQVYRDIYLPACLVQVYRDIYLYTCQPSSGIHTYLPA